MFLAVTESTVLTQGTNNGACLEDGLKVLRGPQLQDRPHASKQHERSSDGDPHHLHGP